jgi:hypothetical protein
MPGQVFIQVENVRSGFNLNRSYMDEFQFEQITVALGSHIIPEY